MVRELAPRDLAAHLRMQAAHRGQSGEIEILAEHERADDAGELVVPPAGDRPRLDPRVALPFAALRDEVRLERLEARHQRSRIAIGPEPQVDAEGESVLGHRGEQRDELAAQVEEIFVVRELARPVGIALIRIDEHQVDVGRNIELAPAELAHADHRELLRLPGRRARRAEPGAQRRVGPIERGGDLLLGELAHRAADLGKIGAALEIARHDAQEHALPQPPQPSAQRNLVVSARTRERVADLIRVKRRPRLQFGLEFRARREQPPGNA